MRISVIASAFYLGLFLLTSCAHLPTSPPKLPAGSYLTVGGARLWYIAEGKGEPVVIISGGPGAAHYLYPYLSALGDSHRVIYLDSFGSGNSDRAKARAEYTFARHVDEIEEVRQSLKLGQLNILGHSYGSLVAQAYALKYPASVKRLILAAPVISGQAMQESNDYVMESLKHQFPEIWTRVQELRARGLHETDKELADVMQQIPEELLYYANISNAGRLNVDFNPELGLALGGSDPDLVVAGELARLDFRPALKNLTMPILVLAGRYDHVFPPLLSLQFKQYAPQARFVMLEKSGHNLFLEENAAMLIELRSFLATTPVILP